MTLLLCSLLNPSTANMSQSLHIQMQFELHKFAIIYMQIWKAVTNISFFIYLALIEFNH